MYALYLNPKIAGMQLRFPIKDIKIQFKGVKKNITHPNHCYPSVCLNQHEFVLDLEGVGCFYACNGNYIELMPYPNVTQNALELYLNGSVYGAVLHQRKNLPLHGSCFSFQGIGVMICGESGVGKSSLTAAFCLEGADFLTDDITPILIKEGKPYIWAISDRIKLWSDSLMQLKQKEEELSRIMPEWGKFYFPMESERGELVVLDHVFILQIHDKPTVEIQEVEGIEKFIALRNEIYRKEFLQGMPESEASYLKKLITISQTVKITKIYRPTGISIEQLRLELEKHILSFLTKPSVVEVVL
ncbi:hypothetical protein [Runella aurantiaca]|uniref:HPr kinase/phosphorylase C-terminal domain-containing protein n=1 Tax=Runella aurantiaca TaxID=2282308 RepID=A0A369I429_9BACT|nr:hypothetical protein [Runella aurantiaca]RDB04328.1 hypothetical protein DVG78_19215 [Runella aurantiaca]